MYGRASFTHGVRLIARWAYAHQPKASTPRRVTPAPYNPERYRAYGRMPADAGSHHTDYRKNGPTQNAKIGPRVHANIGVQFSQIASDQAMLTSGDTSRPRFGLLGRQAFQCSDGNYRQDHTWVSVPRQPARPPIAVTHRSAELALMLLATRNPSVPSTPAYDEPCRAGSPAISWSCGAAVTQDSQWQFGQGGAAARLPAATMRLGFMCTRFRCFPCRRRGGGGGGGDCAMGDGNSTTAPSASALLSQSLSLPWYSSSDEGGGDVALRNSSAAIWCPAEASCLAKCEDFKRPMTPPRAHSAVPRLRTEALQMYRA